MQIMILLDKVKQNIRGRNSPIKQFVDSSSCCFFSLCASISNDKRIKFVTLILLFRFLSFFFCCLMHCYH